MKRLFNILILLIVAFSGYSQQEQQIVVPYTLADRDRAIRTEVKLEALEIKMDAKFEAMNTKFDVIDAKFEAIEGKFDMIFMLIGFIFALLLFMFGYLIWDRRTALYSIREKTETTDNKLKQLILALKEKSQTDKQLAQLLRTHGLL